MNESFSGLVERDRDKLREPDKPEFQLVRGCFHDLHKLRLFEVYRIWKNGTEQPKKTYSIDEIDVLIDPYPTGVTDENASAIH